MDLILLFSHKVHQKMGATCPCMCLIRYLTPTPFLNPKPLRDHEPTLMLVFLKLLSHRGRLDVSKCLSFCFSVTHYVVREIDS